MVKSVTVRAPCSTANLGPGFDVFGMALDALYDNVILTKKGKGVVIVSSDTVSYTHLTLPTNREV